MRFIKRTPILVIFLSIFTAATGILYLVFDLHLVRMTEQVLRGWMQAETVSIQEGHLLSSFAKNQRLLISSDLIRGVALVNIDRDVPFTEIEFGGKIRSQDIQNALKTSDDLQIISLGTFHKLGALRISSSQNFLVFFETHSPFFEKVFLGTVALFCGLFLMMILLVRRIEKKQSIYANLAAQVAHDIRSPISTLNHLAATKDLASDDNQALLKKTIERLQLIVSDLIEKRTDGFSDTPVILGAEKESAEYQDSWIEKVKALVDEKKVLHSEFRGRKIDLQASSTALIPTGSHDLILRSVSNLLDNSIEAIGLAGEVTLQIFEEDGVIHLVIKDTGSGVPEEVLSQIGQPRFSFGKTNGSGMGVYTAKKLVEDMGGQFRFESVFGEGTKVHLIIPGAPCPTEITYIVVDDDPLAHAMWEQTVKSKWPGIKIENFKFFKESLEFESWMKRNSKGQFQIFMDYDLREKRTGLQVLSELKVEKQAFLVTHSFDDPRVQAEASIAGIKMFPKADMSQALAACQ